MKKIKLNITDERILILPELLKEAGKIKYKKEFWEAIGFLKQNETKVKTGIAHFTAEHIRKLCETFEINANWINGQEETLYRRAVVKMISKKVAKKRKVI